MKKEDQNFSNLIYNNFRDIQQRKFAEKTYQENISIKNQEEERLRREYFERQNNEAVEKIKQEFISLGVINAFKEVIDKKIISMNDGTKFIKEPIHNFWGKRIDIKSGFISYYTPPRINFTKEGVFLLVKLGIGTPPGLNDYDYGDNSTSCPSPSLPHASVLGVIKNDGKYNVGMYHYYGSRNDIESYDYADSEHIKNEETYQIDKNGCVTCDRDDSITNKQVNKENVINTLAELIAVYTNNSYLDGFKHLNKLPYDAYWENYLRFP